MRPSGHDRARGEALGLTRPPALIGLADEAIRSADQPGLSAEAGPVRSSRLDGAAGLEGRMGPARLVSQGVGMGR
jgi:hypothetical protein